VFALHGDRDDLVPSAQSVELCEAFGGARLVHEDVVSAQYACGGRGSEVHLFAQGQHGLDICVESGGQSFCRAGDRASQTAIRDAMRRSIRWLKTGSPDTIDRDLLTTIVMTL